MDRQTNLNELINSFIPKIPASNYPLNYNEPTFMSESLYYDTTSFITKINSSPSGKLNIMSLNCDSLSSKLNNIVALLACLEQEGVQIDCLALQETRLNKGDSESQYMIPNFNHISKAKAATHKGSKGGLSIYIHDSYNYKVISSPENNNMWENLFIEVSKNNWNNSLIIGNIYRFPRYLKTDYEEFSKNLTTFLDNIKNKEIALCGDFNINLLSCQTDTRVSDFYDKITSFSLLPRITRPSRFSDVATTHLSGSLIDNIFCNQLCASDHVSGLLTVKISDHLICFTQLKVPCFTMTNTKRTIQIRKITSEGYNQLNNYLSQTFAKCK